MRDRCGLGETAISAARLSRHVVARLRQSFDMRLVNDGVFPRRLRPPLMRPGMRRVDHYGFIHAAGIVTPVEGKVLLFGTHAIAEMRVGPGKVTAQPLAVGIDQKLVGIEAMTRLRLVRPIYAIAVKLSRRDVRKIDVPDVVSPLRHFDALDLALTLAVEQAQFDLRGIGGKQREIGAAPVPGCAERVGSARRDGAARFRERGR